MLEPKHTMRCGGGATLERCRCVVLHRNICGTRAAKSLRYGAATNRVLWLLEPYRASIVSLNLEVSLFHKIVGIVMFRCWIRHYLSIFLRESVTSQSYSLTLLSIFNMVPYGTLSKSYLRN